MPTPYELATKMLGNHEHKNHDILTSYLKNGGQNLNPREKAWCAAFVNSSLQQAGFKGSGSDMARSLLNVGKDTKEPKEGDIAVFSRGDPRGPYGHVGFFKRFDERGNPVILAGNQGNAVSEAPVPINRLLGFRTLDGVPGVSLASNAVSLPPATPAPVAPVTTAALPPVEPTFASKLFGADMKGGKDTPFANITAGLEGILGAGTGRTAPQQPQQAQLDPISPDLRSNLGGQNAQTAQTLMAAILQNRRKPYGMTLTG